MGAWGAIKNGLKKVGKGARFGLDVASVIDPRLRPVAAVVGAAIERAEKAKLPNGAAKAVFAQQIIGDATPAIIATYEQMFQKEVVDEELLAAALVDLQEGMVKFYNAFGIMPPKE